MPEISDNRYQELLAAETDNRRLTTDAENTAKWLKAWREENTTLKEQITVQEATIKENEAKIVEKDDILKAKDEEIATTKETADKWIEHLDNEKTARTESIEKMKTDLWDKFTDDHKSFIDWLEDNKVETFLKWLSPEWGKPPSTNAWDGWDNPWNKDPNAFDIASKDGSIEDMMDAL